LIQDDKLNEPENMNINSTRNCTLHENNA